MQNLLIILILTVCSTGLDTLARLCQVEANEEVICDNLEDATYENIVHLLTIHDIQLIVYSLETLYQLSELGEVTTTHIAAIRMAVGKSPNLLMWNLFYNYPFQKSEFSYIIKTFKDLILWSNFMHFMTIARLCSFNKIKGFRQMSIKNIVK